MKRSSEIFNKKRSASQNIEVVVDDPILIKDTFISSGVVGETSSLYDRIANDFVVSSGDQKSILPRQRNYIKIGNEEETIHRGVFVFDLSTPIINSLVSSIGYTAGMEYSVLHANLTITNTTAENTDAIDHQIEAIMLDVNSNADESITWDFPSSSKSNTSSWVSGGKTEPLSVNIKPTGEKQNNDLSFNITPFVNIWKASGKNTFPVMLKMLDETSPSTMFHSQEAETPLIGADPQTNCVFLGAGDSNTINTDGILVKVQTLSPYLSVELADSSKEAMQRWAAFNASISIGNTFSMNVPDVRTSASTYTMIDKRSTNGLPQLIISGSTAGFETTKHTSAEFICNGKIASGYGIVEFAAPSNTLVTDLSMLKKDDPIIFDYVPSVSPNNASSFTVDFLSDERQRNNRVRLFLKQTTVSENRTGKNTSLKRTSIRPRLSLSLSF